MLSAAAANRHRRFYYRTDYVDATISGWTGAGGGKADTPLLRSMADDHGWLVSPPEKRPDFDHPWKITEAGKEARQRYLSQPKGKRKK